MSKKKDEPSFFDELMEGVQASIDYSRGLIELKTTAVPLPPPLQKAKDIVAMRKQLNVTQQEFAAALNVSQKTVEAWEKGTRTPSSSSARLLQVFREQPAIAERFVARPGTMRRVPERGRKSA